MKLEVLRNYFDKIKLLTHGDNTSDCDIIDYKNGYSISIKEIEEEYYKYLDLVSEIDDYIEENDLCERRDMNKIIEHFSDKVNKSCFHYDHAFLENFVDYMKIKIDKEIEGV